MWLGAGYSASIAACFAFAVSVAAGQAPAPLAISSPASGAVVSPGTTLRVVVVSPSGGSFNGVAVVGEGPLGFSQLGSSVPATLSLTVPANAPARTYSLRAFGRTTAGRSVESAPVTIEVRRTDAPLSISPLLDAIYFEGKGDTSPIVLVARFADGTSLDVTESSSVTYSSANAKIATVSSTGMVTAISTGSTTIVATYTNGTAIVRAVIPVTVPR